MLKESRAKKFLENCRVLEEGEELQNGAGIAVIFDSEEERFNFCEYDYTDRSGEVTWIGTIYLRSILAGTNNSNSTVIAFQKKANKIVAGRQYKLDQASFTMLTSLTSTSAN